MRVHVGGFLKHDGVTATVTLQRLNAQFQYVDSLPLDEQRYGVVEYDPATSSKSTRGWLSYTSNFVISASQMRGHFHLAFTLTSGSGQAA